MTTFTIDGKSCFHGYNNNEDKYNTWLTTSKDLAELYGPRVGEFKTSGLFFNMEDPATISYIIELVEGYSKQTLSSLNSAYTLRDGRVFRNTSYDDDTKVLNSLRKAREKGWIPSTIDGFGSLNPMSTDLSGILDPSNLSKEELLMYYKNGRLHHPEICLLDEKNNFPLVKMFELEKDPLEKRFKELSRKEALSKKKRKRKTIEGEYEREESRKKLSF